MVISAPLIAAIPRKDERLYDALPLTHSSSKGYVIQRIPFLIHIHAGVHPRVAPIRENKFIRVIKADCIYT